MDNALLRTTPLFAGLTDDALEKALAFFGASSRGYDRGEALNRLHAPLPCFGLVLAGTVQVTMENMDGTPLLFAVVERGGIFGESLCYLETDAPVRIVAVTACRVLWLRADAVRDLQCKTALEKTLAQRFTALLARNTLTLNDRIQVLSRNTIREKLMALLAQYREKAGPVFALPFTRNDLAVYLGVNRSALSRELANMRREGLLDYDRRTFRLSPKQDFY